MAELHGKAGTLAILPTIYSAPIEEMRKSVEAVRRAMELQKSEVRSRKSADKKPSTFNLQPSTILGVHLEGPFLNPARCGALDKNSFIRPTFSSFRELIEGYEDIIKIVTAAPEMPGALKIVEKCADMGIRVNMGHSDATYKEAEDGKRAGATGITHIFNAMRAFHHREPGLAGFGLMDDDIYVEVIADGMHLHTETLRLIFRTKKRSRIILVSDSVKGALTGGKAIYGEKGILAGGGEGVAGSARVLEMAGIPAAAIIEAGLRNPERYLSLRVNS